MVFQWRSFLSGVATGALLVAALSFFLLWPERPETETSRIQDVASNPESIGFQSESRRLRDRLEGVQTDFREVDPRPPDRSVPSPEEESKQVEPGTRGESPDRPSRQPESGEKWFDANALLALGVPAHEIDRIQEVWQEYFMNRIRIQNERVRLKAKRKDAAGFNAMNAAQAREKLGDEGFDAMLYAGGERNRVFLSQVLDNSPGATAGLMPGDELISYDEQRIFRPSEIRDLTAQGARDEWVEIQVMRDEELRRFFVRRGPIGAQLEFRSRPPFELP